MTNLPSSNIEYIIELTPLALAMLTNVKDQRELKILSNRIDQLKSEPEKQGKPLVDKLQGYAVSGLWVSATVLSIELNPKK